MTESKPTFESWAIVELFGHTQIAGLVSEATLGGAAFVRVDVPEVDGQPPFTKFYGPGAIYSITPVSEEIARSATERMRPRPVATYYLPAPKAEAAGELAAGELGELGEDDDRDLYEGEGDDEEA